MVKNIDPGMFDLELRTQDRPMLVAFLKRNDRYRMQEQALDDVARRYSGRVRCFLFDADFLEAAMKRFMVRGTPTFLLFEQGRETGRIIGETDSDGLDELLHSVLRSEPPAA
ncbi:thioredoxin family protein [Pseudodesulfovibrio tunisiensis]|uniref:thioredoxin family protein n=1 Tax=Pseudodesulfovibrio tunisiensis TaxID=463192 RepID=UPI001FB3E5D7|nr:thioredoxin family protein [Pseudodesulfovibrio tunisiensis]